MRIKRISKWLSNSELNSHLKDENILGWLLEEGSITQRISANSDFRLEVIKDELGFVKLEEYRAIQVFPQPIRIREVRLYGNEKPIVYAKSIIPFLTSRYGYPDLGTIGGKPLGELIFQSELFINNGIHFAQFKISEREAIWGRRTNYLVNKHPFSIMELFL